MDNELKEEVVLWNLIHNGIVTLRELENDYSYDDFQRLCAFTEFSNDIERRLEQNARSKANQTRR